jgi:membrane-associated protease RseP (regulator of RpoE activity)
VSGTPDDHPEPESLAEQFHVYEVRAGEDAVRYYGEPLADRETVVTTLSPLFRRRGYRVSLTRETGEFVLVARERSPGVDGVPWTNVGLFVATAATTLFAGSRWYGVDALADPVGALGAWPFAASVLLVLAVHEFGHYALSRRHDVDASLPYFIPLPNLVGTLGAVIRVRERVPSRRALFDFGVAGPLAGLAATVVVTAVGVTLPPVAVASGASPGVELGYPPLVRGVAALLGEPLAYPAGRRVNPVVVAGWVGAFVTFLNLLPVGQLDGAHVLRAVAGERTAQVQYLVPALLAGLTAYLVLFEGGDSAGVWGLWAVLALLFARFRGPAPTEDEGVGPARTVVAVCTLLLGLLCFTPTPVVLT